MEYRNFYRKNTNLFLFLQIYCSLFFCLYTCSSGFRNIYCIFFISDEAPFSDYEKRELVITTRLPT